MNNALNDSPTASILPCNSLNNLSNISWNNPLSTPLQVCTQVDPLKNSLHAFVRLEQFAERSAQGQIVRPKSLEFAVEPQASGLMCERG